MTLKDESEIKFFFRHPKDEKIHHTVRGFRESPSNKNKMKQDGNLDPLKAVETNKTVTAWIKIKMFSHNF